MVIERGSEGQKEGINVICLGLRAVGNVSLILSIKG